MGRRCRLTGCSTRTRKRVRRCAAPGACAPVNSDVRQLRMNEVDWINGSLIAAMVVALAVAARGWKERRSLLHFAVPLAMALVLVLAQGAWWFWRSGSVVAEAEFNPGIAPFQITVREVPVPVTGSHHFIVTLSRGQYPVTSFRYFWVGYTPKKVSINWPQLEAFTVTFDDKYVASCRWSWGNQASWSVTGPTGAALAGEKP